MPPVGFEPKISAGERPCPASLIQTEENILSLIVDDDGEENMICMLSLVKLKEKIY